MVHFFPKGKRSHAAQITLNLVEMAWMHYYIYLDALRGPVV